MIGSYGAVTNVTRKTMLSAVKTEYDALRFLAVGLTRNCNISRCPHPNASSLRISSASLRRDREIRKCLKVERESGAGSAMVLSSGWFAVLSGGCLEFLAIWITT